MTASQARRLAGRLRFASLPTPATLEDFDYDAAPAVDPALIAELATCRYLENATNVLLIGPPGLGKTHLAVGLARKAAEAGYRTYFTTAADLAARCHRAAIEGRWATTMRFFNGPGLLVIDELGYLPLPAEAASALFQVISQRYLKTSIVLTSNRGVGSWGEILGDTTVAAALLDNRSTHGFPWFRRGRMPACQQVSACSSRPSGTLRESAALTRIPGVTSVIFRFVADSSSRLLSVVPVPDAGGGEQHDLRPAAGERGLAGIVTLQRRKAAEVSEGDEEGFFLDTIAEYQWARDAAGLAPATLDGLVKPVIEVCEHYGLAPWRLAPRHVDKYFAGEGKRSGATVRRKMNQIDGYFAFLEQRYAGEIARRYGLAVESPVDPFNRPRHRGDFGLRVPPSQRALRELFARWRESLEPARKPAVARRDYVMGKLTYLSGVRAAELCGVRIGDLHWESGQWGRFLVNGKGARGSGPRQREAYMFEEGRALLWWWIEDVRGGFSDDPGHPDAPLFPSERIPQAVSALNVPSPGIAVTPPTFRKALQAAGDRFLTGPVTHLHPHLLRHAAATHNYERGMSLWEVQKLLGHDRPTTTVSYLATAHADPETASLAAAGRAVQRLTTDKGNLR